MAIPDFQTFIRPVLTSVASGETLSLKELHAYIIDVFKLTHEDCNELLPSGKQTIVSNRVGWARTYLNKAKLLRIPSRGLVEITDRGRDALTIAPERITVEWLKRYPEFNEFITTNSGTSTKQNVSPKRADKTDTIDEESTPDERLNKAYQELMTSLADELLEQVMEASPLFFEQLVIDLMISMGYGGSRKEAGSATQATADNGIDGIIKEDKLGLDLIYLQAKRWSSTVHRPEIDKFIGALTRQRARKGVFITTSDFSPGARQAALGLDVKVVLIDGRELAQLMVENNIGCHIKQVYEIKQLDSDYFTQD